MPVWMGRLIMVGLGSIFIAGTLAMTVPSVQRGYFEGRHGAIHRRGTGKYTFHCLVSLFTAGVGLGFIGAGLFLPGETLMRGSR